MKNNQDLFIAVQVAYDSNYIYFKNSKFIYQLIFALRTLKLKQE